MARVQFLATVFDTRQRNQQGVLAIKLKRIYEQMCQEAAKIGLSTHFSDPAKEFYLKDFPNAEKAVSALLRTYSANITSLIDQGTLEAWELSEQKNAKMASAVASAKGMSEEEAESFAPRNREGLEAFRQRRVNGMNLSERVWDFVQHDKQKLELALEVGLTDGRSAAKLSRDVREYLNEPAKLFRRVRDRDGNLRLSKAAAAYHPGRGVYRSSYKNALRMTATETNMAYRTADHEAWANMPFVTGIIINLSKNHTCLDSKGVPRPFHDICDELKGEYPKDFKYVGWHPHCRCYVTAKLADQEEIDKYAIASDEERENFHFSNEVKDVPEKFTSWIDENAERIENAKSLPYFIKDNYVGGDIDKGFKWEAASETDIDALKRTFDKTAKFVTKEEADKALRESAEAAWKVTTEDEKDGICDYSSFYYIEMQDHLRGIEAHPELEDIIDATARFIDKCSLPKDCVLTRRSTRKTLLNFGIEEGKLNRLSEQDLKNLIGKSGIEKGFTSCHSYDNNSYAFVHVEILAPKGTKAAYIEPFSELGMGGKRDWDGLSKQTQFSFEQETTLQKGTEFTILDAFFNEDKTITLKLAVTGQP